MQIIYGYVVNGHFVETGLTAKGAKSAATQAGFTEVGYRSPINNMYIPTHYKKDGRWFENLSEFS